MHIINNKNNISFCNFYNVTSNVQQNVVLNRALIDAGGIFPWLIQCNNKEERTERIINLSTFFGFAFVAPVINVPAANRIAMRCQGLTDGLLDNNHKAIQLSNEFLTKDDKLLKGLDLYNKDKKFASSPIERLFGKNSKQINVDKLLKKCQDNPELLRKRLVYAKNLVLFSDLVITGVTLGSLGFLNNYLTKKRTGKSGFSAELNMADSKIIEQRSEKYERNKKFNMTKLAGIIMLISAGTPFIMNKGMISKNKNKFTEFIKNHAKYTDYTKGIFMSRFVMLLGIIMNMCGLLLASRNETERKDWLIRCLVTNPIFLGGDLVTASLISNTCDKLFKTKLTENGKNDTILRRIFPKVKPLESINKEVENKKISNIHKPLAAGVYWGNLIICAYALAYIVPTICNKMIKSDVDNYVHKHSAPTQDYKSNL